MWRKFMVLILLALCCIADNALADSVDGGQGNGPTYRNDVVIQSISEVHTSLTKKIDESIDKITSDVTAVKKDVTAINEKVTTVNEKKSEGKVGNLIWLNIVSILLSVSILAVVILGWMLPKKSGVEALVNENYASPEELKKKDEEFSSKLGNLPTAISKQLKQSLSQELSNIGKISADMSGLVDSVNSIKKQLSDDLVGTISKNLSGELGERLKPLENLERDLEKLQSKVQELEFKLEKLRIDEAALERKRSEIDSREKKVDDLAKELNGQIAAVRNKVMEQKNGEIAKLKEDHSAEKRRLMELNNGEIAKLRDEIRSFGEKLAQEKQRFNELEVASSKRIESAREDERKSAESRSAAEIADLRSQLENFQRQYDVVTKEKNRLNEQLAAANSEVRSLNSAVESAKQAKEQAESHLNEAKIRLANEQSVSETLRQEKASLENQNHQAMDKIGELQRAVEAGKAEQERLEKSVYPQVFLEDSDFAPLKAHMESWQGKCDSGCEIIRGALTLFANRNALPGDVWQQALHKISHGVALAMKEMDAAALNTELVQWSNFLTKFSDEECNFSLKIPGLGEAIDFSWMKAASKKTTRVGRVCTWAVWHNEYGVMCNAEVE